METINLTLAKNSDKIEVLKSNFRVQFSFKVEDKIINGSKEFFSNKKLNYILNSFLKFNDNGDFKVKFVVVDKINKKSITRYINLNTMMSVDEIKEMFMKNKNFIDVQQHKYRVVIDNCESNFVDKKSFTINCNESISDVLKKLHDLMKLIIDNEKDDFVIFTTQESNSSHRILVQKCGSLNNYKNYESKSFSIKFSNFSSSEIVDLMVKKIMEKGGQSG